MRRRKRNADAEWWFNLWIVRRNEKKEEDVDGRGLRVVVHFWIVRSNEKREEDC
jgi:hypothetical protein